MGSGKATTPSTTPSIFSSSQPPTLVLILSRFLAFILKPLRQPKVFLFLVGLELDFRSIRRSGRQALSIAVAGISVPFVCGVGMAFVLRRTIPGANAAGCLPFLVFMGVALSTTAFPVLAGILAELKLLTTELGETAMDAAALNDVVAWVLLALAVALSGSDRSPVVLLWALLCGLPFVAVQMVAVRLLMARLARRGEGEVWICLTLAGVVVLGFLKDFIGIHSIFGGFVFGLTVPTEGVFGRRLVERTEDFVSGLLLPLYFASSGSKTNVATTIEGAQSWALLVRVIGTACAGKKVGTFLVVVACGMAARESAALGLLLNTNGLVELTVLTIGKVLDPGLERKISVEVCTVR